MIQDIAPHIYNNAYRNVLPQSSSVLLSFTGDTVLCKTNGNTVCLPLFADCFGGRQAFPPAVYLFSIDDAEYFLLLNPAADGCGFACTPVFSLRDARPQHTAFAVLAAYGLYTWYAAHVYCGKCGSRNNIHTAERMLMCPSCGNMEYPKISPAVIVAVVNGDELLLSKYAGRVNSTRYALIAGFAESGETIEQTVVREVKEETGLNVKNIRYYKSQPWGLSSSLLFGFFAELDGSNVITIDETELSEARWFARDRIPPADSVRSLTGEMIEYFRNSQGKFLR